MILKTVNHALFHTVRLARIKPYVCNVWIPLSSMLILQYVHAPWTPELNFKRKLNALNAKVVVLRTVWNAILKIIQFNAICAKKIMNYHQMGQHVVVPVKFLMMNAKYVSFLVKLARVRIRRNVSAVFPIYRLIVLQIHVSYLLTVHFHVSVV